MSKRNTFYGAAAILTVSTILVKIIGAIFKIPLIAILPEEAYGDFNGAYNIYSFFLTISTAGLPVRAFSVSKARMGVGAAVVRAIRTVFRFSPASST